jgi:hypothetical protein
MSAWMRHPDLPADQLIQVDDLAVPHHQGAGWEIAEAPKSGPQPRRTPEAATPQPEQPVAPEPAEEADAEPSEPAPAPSKRRAAAKESDK